jgi:CheY-like chemotaxis protein
MIYNVLVAESDNDRWTCIAKGVRRFQPEAAIVRVKDGEQAMRYLFQRGLFTEEPETPHLIVLATQLPIVPTHAVIDRVLQHPRTQSIPVVVIRPDAGRDDFDEQLASELYPPPRPRVVELCATASIEKDLASTLTRLHGVV